MNQSFAKIGNDGGLVVGQGSMGEDGVVFQSVEERMALVKLMRGVFHGVQTRPPSFKELLGKLDAFGLAVDVNVLDGFVDGRGGVHVFNER